ncbi:MAG: hypothetical protein HUU11_13145 [Anaerolineales bacterium]|nr:hypothetical protein [Anaerolineales bacterium]
MKAQFSQKDNSGMALVTGIAGLLCFIVLPLMIARTMTAVLEGAAVKAQLLELVNDELGLPR